MWEEVSCRVVSQMEALVPMIIVTVKSWQFLKAGTVCRVSHRFPRQSLSTCSAKEKTAEVSCWGVFNTLECVKQDELIYIQFMFSLY